MQNNKRTSVVLGMSGFTREPTEAQQAFRPHSGQVNRKEAELLKDSFKKPNFSLAELHGRNARNLYTSTSSIAQRQGSQLIEGNR